MNKEHNIQKATFAKECMFMALKKLMSEKDFDDIKISELTELAGISRTTFYRNYNSKQDILRDYLNINPLGASSIVQYDFEHFSLYDRIHDCYKFIYENQVLISNIINAHMEEIIINNFLGIMKGICAKRANEYGFVEEYELSALAGMCFMVCYDWLSKGMVESIDEITNISYKIINNYKNSEKF